MSGQTLRENIEQDVQYLLERCMVKIVDSGNIYGPFDSYGEAFVWGACRRDGVVSETDAFGVFTVIEAT